jgi:hypothetical protein
LFLTYTITTLWKDEAANITEFIQSGENPRPEMPRFGMLFSPEKELIT